MRKETPSDDDDGGTGALVSGAFWLSLGTCVTALTFLLARTGGRYVIAYGAVIAGGIAFVRGLASWNEQRTAPFPWRGIAIAGAAPWALALLVGGGVKARGSWKQRELRAQQASLAAELDRRAADEQRAQAQAAADSARDAADADRARGLSARGEAALDALLSAGPSSRLCTAAQTVSRVQFTQAAPELRRHLTHPDSSVRACMASALAAIGEVDAALEFFAAEAASDHPDRRRTGVSGLGEIGPRAVPVALPILETVLRSTFIDERQAAVHTLGLLGPDAEPLLRRALDDADETVRLLAQQGLRELGAE